MLKQKHLLLVLIFTMVLLSTACGKKEVEDNSENLIDNLVTSEDNQDKAEQTKPKGEKPKDTVNTFEDDVDKDKYGDALDGYNIQSNTGDIKLNMETETIVSSGKVVNTDSIGDLSDWASESPELQNSNNMYNLNINRFMYETNLELVNISIDTMNYTENGCSQGMLNSLISKIDLLDTRNNYIQYYLIDDVDIITTWNEYYQFIQSIRGSIEKLDVSSADIDKLGRLSTNIIEKFSNRLVGYDYMSDILNSENTNNDYFIENEDNTVGNEDSNANVETEDNIVETEDTENSIEDTETESSAINNEDIESSENNEITDEDNSVTVE